MSRLLPQPATWPHLNLNPEPRGTAMDPDSIERWYSELFGADSEKEVMSNHNVAQPENTVRAYLKNRCRIRPAVSAQPFPPRR